MKHYKNLFLFCYLGVHNERIPRKDGFESTLLAFSIFLGLGSAGLFWILLIVLGFGDEVYLRISGLLFVPMALFLNKKVFKEKDFLSLPYENRKSRASEIGRFLLSLLVIASFTLPVYIALFLLLTF